MTLVRWNPAKELLNLDREFKKIFNAFDNESYSCRNSETESKDAVWSPLTDIVEDNDKYTLKLDLPGVDKKDVKLSFKDGELSISGERKEEKESKDSKYHRVERSYGKYYRSFKLPEKIKDDGIKAEFKNGTLAIEIPKAEEVKPREIEINLN